MSTALTGQRSVRAAAIASTPDPGADIEHVARPPPLEQAVERQKAAARGAVMAGAEGKRRLDFDADPVWRDAGTVMRAMHGETPGLDRGETGKALRHPVGSGGLAEFKRRRCSLASRLRHQRCDRGLIGGLAEMDLQPPLSVARFEGRTGGVFRIEAVAKIEDEPPRRRLVAAQGRDGGDFAHCGRTFALRILPRNGYVARHGD